jgi:O-antigen ligase
MNVRFHHLSRWLWISAFAVGAVILAMLVVKSILLGLVVVILGVGLLFALVWGHHLTRRRLIITLLMCSILLPDVLVPGLWDIRPEEILTLALIPIILTQISWYWTRFDVFFALVGVSTVISIIWGVLLGVPFSPRDVMELVKIAKYWLFFHLALYPWDERDINTMLNYVLIFMAVAACVGIWQRQNWLGVGRMLQALYGRGASHAQKGRIVGTMANPNDFALLLVTGFALVASAFKDASRRRRVFLAILGILLMIGTAITSSRTGVVGIVIVLVAGFALRIFRSRFVVQRLRWLVIASMAILLAAIIIAPWVGKEFRKIETMTPWEVLDYVDQNQLYLLLYRFSIAASEEEGIGVRVARWESHWEAFLQSPVVGWGPGKSSYATIVDSEYVFYLRRYGVVGLGLLLFLYCNIILFCRKLLRYRSSEAWRMGAFLITTLLVYLAANFVLYTFYILQLMSLFWLMVGTGYSRVYFSPGEKSKFLHNKNISS